MSGEELQRNICEAWHRVRQKLLSDPGEIQRRLARRRLKSLTSPPRASCIAIRASDRRITPMHWVIFPEHAMHLNHPHHPYEPIEHEVTIQNHAIRRYCHPTRISREDAADVAKWLGTTPRAILQARSQGVFHTRLIPHLGGKRGKPVPLISNGGELLDSGFARFFRRPHPLWGADWEFISHLFPDDFEQTIIRKPHFARVKKSSWHPDDPAHLWGWRWICPGCKKAVKSIYFPVPVRTMFDRWIDDSVMQEKLGGIDLPPQPLPAFACHKCHNIQFFTATNPARAWNQFITCISDGLLYGREVKRPDSFVPQRHNTRVRQLNRAAPIRRKVLARLSNGWSDRQIAEHLEISLKCARAHIYLLCREERVPNVQALAQNLNFAKPPARSERAQRVERARARRPIVQQMLLANYGYDEIAQKLGVSRIIISDDVRAIYRAHAIKAKGSVAGKRALAQKLGLHYLSRADQLRSRVSELRENGLTWNQVAREMGMPVGTASNYATKLSKLEAPPANPPAPNLANLAAPVAVRVPVRSTPESV